MGGEPRIDDLREELVHLSRSATDEARRHDQLGQRCTIESKGVVAGDHLEQRVGLARLLDAAPRLA